MPSMKTTSPIERKQSEKRQRAMVVQQDRKRIEDAIKSGTAEERKLLHIELDGTYGTEVFGWDTSLYGYIPARGFSYEVLGDDSISDNLRMMQGKLRGFMLKLDPEAERISVPNNENLYVGDKRMTSKQKKLLHDYGQIKAFSLGNMAINIQDTDYPLLRDTLLYMEQYEYIRPLNVDSGDSRVYMKTPAFEAFAEHVLAQDNASETEMEKTFNNKKVFIVHGHDHALLNEVEIMLRRIGLEPIILKDQANGGRTIIEKIEDYTDVGFGVVLYTGCDEGREKGTDTLASRARQNVVFEHGYLCAKLGRARVVALNDNDVEVPSDLSGVLYISRSAANWKQQLMREMQNAELEFDSLNA